jgi:hypothetical protein
VKEQQDTTTVQPIEVPPSPVSAAPVEPEFIRLPKGSARCPYTGLTRSYLNSLILGDKPPVKSICLRKLGAARGCRLIVWESLRDYLHSQSQGA